MMQALWANKSGSVMIFEEPLFATSQYASCFHSTRFKISFHTLSVFIPHASCIVSEPISQWRNAYVFILSHLDKVLSRLDKVLSGLR